jgi:predicted transcriptional regulator
LDSEHISEDRIDRREDSDLAVNKRFEVEIRSMEAKKSDLIDLGFAQYAEKVRLNISVRFTSLNELMSFLFPGKFLLLMMIRAKKPSSMYELAQMAGRSQSGVLGDCKELESVGLIILTKLGPRNSIRPSLPFDFKEICIHSDIGTSHHTFPTPCKIGVERSQRNGES